MIVSSRHFRIPVGNPGAADRRDAAGGVRPAIVPLFLPFAGCPHRCLFCAQDKQTGETGTASALQRLAALLTTVEKRHKEAENTFRPVELAFYGGTFTALPRTFRQECLSLAAEGRRKGLVSRIRCSTRPDAVEAALLTELKEAGLDLVELGVQSFHTEALNLSQRGYTGERAREGCRIVRNSGLALGIQLLPGMPGSTPEGFASDVEEALAFSPACLRFYPCLVVDGTPLAEAWRAGTYEPWDTETTVSALSRALAKAWERRVPVIRLSLAPEPDLDRAVLAGPRHPALGNLIQGEALLRIVRAAVRRHGPLPPDELALPRFCQGFFFGHKKNLVPRWEALGINPSSIRWIGGENAVLQWKSVSVSG